MRFIRYFAAALLLVAAIYAVSMVMQIIAFGFSMGPISIDLTLARAGAVVVFGALIVVLILMIFLEYVPKVVIEGEEV